VDQQNRPTVPASPNQPPAPGGTPAAPPSPPTATKVIDASKEAGLGWHSHQANSLSGVSVAHRRHWFGNPAIIGPVALVVVLIISATALILIRKPGVSKALKQATGVDLQNIGDAQLKQLAQAAGNSGTKETLTVTANGVFQHNLSVNGAADFQGGLNSKQIITGQNGLNISGASTLDSLTLRQDLNVNGKTNLQSDVDIKNLLTVHGKLGVGGDAGIGGGLTVGNNLTVNGSLAAGSLSVRELTVPDTLTLDGHIVTGGGSPTVSPGPGAGGGSVHVSGNDTSGTLIIDVGASPIVSNLATVNFHRVFGTVPKVILTPVGTSSAKLQYYTSRTPQNFTVFTNTLPAAGTEYVYDYFVIE
jgi:hypothetical protein